MGEVAIGAHIEWMEWGPEAFDRARREDKLILLDSGATWCHWCHVMDRRTYDDPEAAALISARFIPVRIDRDRLPDVDARFQHDQPLIASQGGGWPLTAVVTPEGRTLFKATFLPPRTDPHFAGGPGLIELLTYLDSYWRQHRQEVQAASEELECESAEHPAQAFAAPGKVSMEQVEIVLAGLRDAYDNAHGGFGSAPKFYLPAALELLAARSWTGDSSAREMFVRTLEAAARGGVYDQLGGGFHRYSVDERWHVPHFEKMAYDNAALLGLYADAYALTGREAFRRVAGQTAEWMSDTLADPRGRGFYASQDADASSDDDGDYYTWTAAEIRMLLGNDALAVGSGLLNTAALNIGASAVFQLDYFKYERRALPAAEYQQAWDIVRGNVNGSWYPEVGHALGQYWAFYRLAEYFFVSNDPAAWAILENWLNWFNTNMAAGS